MTGEQAARALGQRLNSTDLYTCSTDHGAAVSGEPDWTYECLNATDPQRSGYFVLVRGGKVAQVQPSG